MKKSILTMLLLLLPLLTFAGSKITKTYHQRPLSDVLIEIDEAAPELTISFIYNKLEDYTVTCSIQNATPLEAIQQAVGFYPIRVAQKGATVLVEPQFESGRNITGRVVDERGEALEFANVALLSMVDNSLFTGGVTNAGGDFVIPCEPTAFTVRVSYVGYETQVREIEFPQSSTRLDLGTFSLKVDPQALAEVKVESDLATTSAEKTTYYPSSRHKNAATDAVSLLHHMMIPQLRLNPLTGYVTTLSGASVAIFIDHIPASADDLAGMNTQDVKRVEILDFPSDVRFQGKPHVINFVMQKYETGGYTKISSTEIILADFTSTNSVYSKLAHKNWTFDANLTGRFSNKKHMGMEKTETFRLPTQTVTRTETVHDGKQRTERNSASLRATYSSEKMQLANRFEFLDEITPRQELQGSVLYSPASLKSSSRQSLRSTTPTYEGDWNFALPKQWMIHFNSRLQFSRNKQNRFYQEGSSPAIENRIKESTHALEGNLVIGRSFAKKHTVSLGAFGVDYASTLDYNGSTEAHQTMSFTALGFPLSYNFNTQKFNLSTQLIFAYQGNKVNGEKDGEWSPLFNFSATYAFNQKNSLNFSVNHSRSIADGAERNPSVLQTNELLYYCGNPMLENYLNYFAKIQYNWLPSNILSASVFAEHYYDRNYYGNVWQLYDGGAAVLRRIENVGDAHSTNFGASFTLRLLDNNLQFNAYPYLSLMDVSGQNAMKSCAFSLDLKASYYIGQFYFRGGYSLPEKLYYRESTAWQKKRSYYYLSAGWGNKHWKAKLDFVNPFRNDWRDYRTTISTPIYSQVLDNFNASSHQRINLTVSYTFNYGKKVKAGNELGTASGGQSSIL